MMHTIPILDARDQEILARRQQLLDESDDLHCGDFVRFPDGLERRISYVWRNEDGTAWHVQTSAGGSYYLGEGYVSMSGSLFQSVPADTLTRTDETRVGRVWFFHHNWAYRDNGVDVTARFRVYTCSVDAPTS